MRGGSGDCNEEDGGEEGGHYLAEDPSFQMDFYTMLPRSYTGQKILYRLMFALSEMHKFI